MCLARRVPATNDAHFWYLLISRSATVPGLYLCGFLTPPEAWGADLRAALVATGGIGSSGVKRGCNAV